jgi:hypothetical protein
MNLALVVVTYFGIVIQAHPAPVDLAACRAGIDDYRAGYLKSWADAGFNVDGIKITCEAVGTLKLVRRGDL